MDQRRRMIILYVVVRVVLGIALALQVAGFATRGWLVLKYEEGSSVVKSATGLWSAKTCIDSLCVTGDHAKNDNLYLRAISTGMLEYQVETSIALGLLVIAIIMYSCTQCGPCKKPGIMKNIVYCTVFCTIISGILALVAAAQFGNKVRKDHDTLKLLRGESPVEVPYSVILTGIGGILAGVMAPAILYIWKSNSRPPPPSHGMQAQPNVVVYHGQPQPGYNYHGQSMAPYAGQPQPGYNYHGQPLAPYAGQPQPEYYYHGQPSAPYSGQPSYGQKF